MDMSTITQKLIPGEIIKFVYLTPGGNDKDVHDKELLWSSRMERWIPIGSNLTHVILSVDKHELFIQNEKGTWTLSSDDFENYPYIATWVVRPRKE